MKSLLITIVTVMLMIWVLSIPALGDIQYDWKWENQDYIIQILSSGLYFWDWSQTKGFMSKGGYYETNPLLGPFPSQCEIDRYFMSNLCLDLITNIASPRITITFKNGDKIKINLRFFSQIESIYLESKAVFHNINVGAY